MGIVLKVSMIALLILTGFAFGGQPLFGYYFGLDDRARLSRLFRFMFIFILSVAIVLTLLIVILAPVLIEVFMDDEMIIRDGSLMLRLQVITMPLVGIILLLTIIFQAAGEVTGSFILSIGRQGVIFLIVLLLLNCLTGYIGVISAQAVSDVITVLLAFLLFHIRLRSRMR